MAAFAVQTASDPRDYIYALLSLVSPAESSLIEPNYRAPVADVFTHFTRTMIDKQGRWGFLHRVQWTGSSDMGLPSWVVTCLASQIGIGVNGAGTGIDLDHRLPSVYSLNRIYSLYELTQSYINRNLD